MIGAAKRKSSLLPGLAALRLVLLLIVTLCLGETRVWGFAITPQPTSGVFESVTPSCIGQNTTAIGYDASDSLPAAKNPDDVIHVSPNGVACPPGPKYQIPFNYIENPNRSGSYGVMENGKFVEKLRVDAATPPGMKGPNYGHYHLDG